MLVGVPTGTLVDRLPRRPILVACDLVSAVLLVSAPVAAWLGLLTLTQLLIVAFLAGVAEVFSATAGQVFLPAVLPADQLAAGNVISASFRQCYCPPELLGRVTASMRVVNYGTMPVAAVVAGALATAVGLRTTMWVGTAGVLAAALLLLVGPLTGSRDLPETPDLPEARRLPAPRDGQPARSAAVPTDPIA